MCPNSTVQDGCPPGYMMDAIGLGCIECPSTGTNPNNQSGGNANSGWGNIIAYLPGVLTGAGDLVGSIKGGGDGGQGDTNTPTNIPNQGGNDQPVKKDNTMAFIGAFVLIIVLGFAVMMVNKKRNSNGSQSK